MAQRRSGSRAAALSPTKDAIQKRRETCLDLRIQGKSFRQIGEEVGISGRMAFGDVRVLLNAHAKQRNKLAARLLELDLTRLDDLMQRIYAVLARAELEQDGPLVLQAADRVLRVIERRARLVGLEKPPELYANINMIANANVLIAQKSGVTPEQIENRVRELFKKTRGIGTEKEPIPDLPKKIRRPKKENGNGRVTAG